VTAPGEVEGIGIQLDGGDGVGAGGERVSNVHAATGADDGDVRMIEQRVSGRGRVNGAARGHAPANVADGSAADQARVRVGVLGDDLVGTRRMLGVVFLFETATTENVDAHHR